MLLGLDLGTTRIKAALAAPDGRIVSRGSAPVKMFPVGDDGVEQDIEDIWAATLSAIAELPPDEISSVRAVGVSSQGGALQVCDGQSRPAGRVISWLDGRGRAYNEEITLELGGRWFARHTGHGGSGVSVGQLLRLRHEAPELLQRPGRISFVGDVIVSRLCGRCAHDATSLSIAVLFNPWLRTADPELLERLGIGEDQLPELLPPSTAAGALSAEASAITSLRAGIPVSPAVHDQYAAALGASAIHDGDVMFGAGTAWVLLAATSRLTEPVIGAAFVCTHLAEGLYSQMLSLVTGGSAFAWAADLVGWDWQDHDETDRLLQSVAAGSDGLRFWPFLVPGAGAGLKSGTSGRLTGLRLSHAAAHVVRATVEGLALELARCLRFLTDAGMEVKRLVMCGGGADSRVTPQIIADVTGLPIACTTETDMSALGAAIVARGLLEQSADLAALSEVMTPPVREFNPGSDSPLYQQLLEKYVASLPLAGP